MSYAHPEVLVDTEWLSQNPPNENRKLVEVDYDPVNGYQKGHINGASLIWSVSYTHLRAHETLR